MQNRIWLIILPIITQLGLPAGLGLDLKLRAQRHNRKPFQLSQQDIVQQVCQTHLTSSALRGFNAADGAR